MEKLNKHTLEFAKTFNFVRDNLENVNGLSTYILKHLDMEKGKFFTLLPKNSSLNQLYNFDLGGIVPQKPHKTAVVHVTGVGDFFGVEVKNIKRELAEFILENLSKNIHCLAIFDDYQIEKVSPFAKINNVTTLYKNNEVYHLLNSKNTEEDIFNVVKKTHAIWHSLGIIFKDQTLISNQLSDDILENICKNIEYLILSAYDGEGYIFWEPNR